MQDCVGHRLAQDQGTVVGEIVPPRPPAAFVAVLGEVTLVRVEIPATGFPMLR